ncbi:hypothetical protein [Legionella yabuuchiae]|uniref:hypothetical protein n=1 Tax=Legionella yabuuchiae TaxID=376727 RepID=UPI001055E5F8|nr:hypothetical protein [Legionella yabuuchiae]
MKKSNILFITLTLLFPSVLFASTCEETKSNYCSLDDLKKDSGLDKSFNLSKDPAGLAVEAKQQGVDASSLFQEYANKNNCVLYSISMMELVKGLFKGSTDGLFKQNSQNSSDTHAMSNKYILVDGDKALCIKKLDLKLPIKEYSPQSDSKNNQ